MRCVLCGTPLRDMIWQCDCGGRLGERHIPFNPSDVPAIPLGRVEQQPEPGGKWLREKTKELAHYAEQIARQRRQIAAERRRREFRVIEEGRCCAPAATLDDG